MVQSNSTQSNQHYLHGTCVHGWNVKVHRHHQHLCFLDWNEKLVRDLLFCLCAFPANTVFIGLNIHHVWHPAVESNYIPLLWIAPSCIIIFLLSLIPVKSLPQSMYHPILLFKHRSSTALRNTDKWGEWWWSWLQNKVLLEEEKKTWSWLTCLWLPQKWEKSTLCIF